MRYDKETVEKAWIQGVGSRVITPLDLQPEQIDLDDVTHSLGYMCRYTGRTKRFYSVAEHSLIVHRATQLLELPIGSQRWALAHDFGEAYLSDVSNPLKRTLVFEEYRKLEAEIDEKIRQRFRIDVTELGISAVREVDVEACNVERSFLLAPEPKPWNMPPSNPRVTLALVRAWNELSALHRSDAWNFGEQLNRVAREVLGE